MKLLRIIAALSLCATAWGQGSRFDSNVFTAALNVPPGAKAAVFTVPFAQIRVCAYPATFSGPNSLCTNQVNIYSDPGLTQLVKQPFLSDAQGRFGFWAAPGQYSYSIMSGSQYLATYSFSLAGAGGGQATFPSTPGVVYGLSASSARTATAADISGLFTGTSPCALMKDGSCVGISSGSVTDFTADPSGWPSWLVPAVANHNTSPGLSVTASAIPNAALQNSVTTVNGTACALGTSCTIPIGGVTSINATPGPFTFNFDPGAGSCSGTTCTFSGAGATYPGAGVANSTGTAWGTSYGSSNPFPANFLPLATTGAFGAVKPDGTTITIASGVISAVGGGGGCGTGTTGFLLQFTSTSACGNSYIDYGVTNAGAYTSTKDLYIPEVHFTGSGPLSFPDSLGGSQYIVGSTGPVSLTDASPIVWATAGVRLPNATVTLNHATSTRALNVTGLVSGASGVLIVKQDSTGGADLTGGTGCTWKQAGGGGGTFGLTTAANSIDILAFSYDGTNCYVSMQKNFN